MGCSHLCKEEPSFLLGYALAWVKNLQSLVLAFVYVVCATISLLRCKKIFTRVFSGTGRSVHCFRSS